VAALLVVASLAFAAHMENPSVPSAPPPAKAPHATSVTRVIHGEPGKPGDHGDVKIEMDGRQMTVTATEDGKLTTTVVDLDQVGDIVEGAVGEAMTALKDLQLQVRVGQDNRIDVSTAEGTYQVDLDAIMTEVAAAVQSGLKDIDTEEWASQGPRDARDEAELRKELGELQKEMRGLREELRRLSAEEAAKAGK
jgi:hypothetical protein